jgi:chemotaxis family two-component system response regulator PixG
MKNFQTLEFNQLATELTTCRQLEYTGQLNIKNEQKEWKFYYKDGLVVWVTGGKHPCRRWRRSIARYFPNIDPKEIQYNAEDMLVDYWDYLLFKKICIKYRITRQQIDKLLQNIISEIVFDIIQQMNYSSLKFERQQELVLKSSLVATDANPIIKQAQELWMTWEKAGLNKISPDLAPVLKQPEQLKPMVSQSVFNNFTKLINGNNTLWDLSLKMNKNPLQISLSLLPYIQQGIIGLIELPDLPSPQTKLKGVSNFSSRGKQSNIPLIACVDDSPQICKIVEKIITAHGMRFIGIQQPIEALPILMENKPDLIFLDLMMPVVSGYEVCKQLRRCSQFSDTPIVILTGSDGVFDHVRSKVFGATEFMNKPVETAKIMGSVYKHLQPEQQVALSLNWAFS